MYQLINDKNSIVCCVLRLGDNISIPLSPDNTDYQQYLAWLSEGNLPTPADEGAA